MDGTPCQWQMTGVGEALRQVAFEPRPAQQGEVVIEVAGCGVCHTDLGFLYDGVPVKHPLPLTLGHEISGRVVGTGADTGDWAGRAVVVPAVIPCGHCDLCARGLGTICRSQQMPGNDVHGGFASHVTVPAHGLCAVDEPRLAAAGLQLADVAVLADAVTTPYQAATQAGVGEGDLAIVIGAGGIGGYAVQVAAALGATVVAVDVDPAKLAALEAHGLALGLDAREHDARALKKAIGGFARERGLRATEWKIFECSGTTAGQQTAFGLLTFGAHLAVVGFTMGKLEVRLSNLMAFHATAEGNWGCLPDHYPAALELVLDGRVAMTPFIERHPLDEINDVFAAAHEHRLTRRAIMVP